jgi:hypothetical protein
MLREQVARFRASGAVQACAARFQATGVLDCRISFVPDDDMAAGVPPGVTIQAGGDLAGTPAGDCIYSALEQSLKDVEVTGARYYPGAIRERFTN